MTVTRHLALWAACALSVTTTASANEGLVAKFQDAPGGIWKVCSPAWAFPQLDDAALTADEAWRVEKYLGRAACSSSTPIICHICAGLAERSDGASNAPATCPLRKGDQPFDSLLQQTTGQVVACAQILRTDSNLHRYYVELSCLLEAYSRATPLVVLPPSLQWRFRFGDETMAMKGAYLTKARKVGKSDQAVLLPVNTRRHARDLRPLQRITEHKLPTFLAREKCAMWRGVTTGQLPAYEAYEARVAHPAAAANISANARAHVLKTLGASAASERRVVMAVLRGYRQALACAQSA